MDEFVDINTDWGWVGDWMPRLHRNVLGGWTFGWLWLRVYTKATEARERV